MAEPSELILKLASNTVKRSIIKDNDLRRELVECARRVWKSTDSGLVVGPAVQIPFNKSRFEKSIDKIVRALYFYKTNSPLPKTHNVFISSDDFEYDSFKEILSELGDWEGLGDEVFNYRCTCSKSDPAQTAWLFMFYLSVPIFAATLPHK